MEPFKDKINAAVVRQIAEIIPGDFDRRGFVENGVRGLEALELKARVHHIADTLYQFLPNVPRGIETLLAGLPPAPDGVDDLIGGFRWWPVLSYVERHGLGCPDEALASLHRLTAYFSAEFAIRPYFAADPERVLATLKIWSTDPNVHVRRLVSEGSRPRLPWGTTLSHRIQHPRDMLPILCSLRDDPEEYVRRSVANHLNDIARDHPELVLEVASSWMKDAPTTRKRLIKHALRTLIKAGDPRAFALIGLPCFDGTVHTELSPDTVAVGEAVTLTVVLRSTSTKPQRVRLDYAVHYRKKNGSLAPKVFHWTERTLDAGDEQILTRKHTFKVVTTRTLYAGAHALDLRVNGAPSTLHPFQLC